MPLKDYTTSISALKTLGEIQGTLVEHGAKKILTDYDDDGRILSLSFMINTPHGMLPIQLPSNVDRVDAVLTKQRVKHDRAQAERVAWRILKDWVQAQMAILESEMVDMAEIFLPYVVQGERTLYQVFQDQQMRLTEGK